MKTTKTVVELLSIAVVVGVSAGCGPTAGESCTAGTGACEGTETFLECKSGVLTRTPCRGTKGCTTAGTLVTCDQGIGIEGETCSQPGTGACAQGGRAELACQGGTFKKVKDCVTCDVTATNLINCIQPCGAATCAGCCLNGACQAGVANSACGKGGGACLVCGAGESCDAQQRCGIDPNTMWKVQPSQFVVRTTDSGGAAWDVGGGAPDPYASIACPATSMMRVATATANDAFMGTWTTGSCTMKASDLLSLGFNIGVYDEDVADDDVIAGAGTITVTEAHLRAGQITLSNNTTLTSLVVTLTRQ